jgi:hypothetical protein
MPLWLHDVPPLIAAAIMVVFIETISLIGLFLVRRLLIGRFYYHEGANDAVSGTVHAIGVFYGITVGLIAIGVWDTNSNAYDLVSKEATSIGVLYRDVSSYPQPVRDELRGNLREYTVFIIEQTWPGQKKGQILNAGTRIMDDFQARLNAFEPLTPGQASLHAETLRAYNNLIEYRRLRIGAVNSGLSIMMWAVIWVGAAITIAVVYFFKLHDAKLHAILVALMGGFLAMVLFMIMINDKPFYGYSSVSSEPYKLILDRLIDLTK